MTECSCTSKVPQGDLQALASGGCRQCASVDSFDSCRWCPQSALERHRQNFLEERKGLSISSGSTGQSEGYINSLSAFNIRNGSVPPTLPPKLSSISPRCPRILAIDTGDLHHEDPRTRERRVATDIAIPQLPSKAPHDYELLQRATKKGRTRLLRIPHRLWPIRRHFTRICSKFGTAETRLRK